jgi:hypothetical protein
VINNHRKAIEGNFASLPMGIYKSLTPNIFNGEIFKACPLRWDLRQGCLLSPLLFNAVLKILANVRKREKHEVQKE